MPEAAPSITRRAFMRESAVLASLSALPAHATTPDGLPDLIARHRLAEAAWLDLDAAYGDHQSPHQERHVQAAYATQAKHLTELLAFRPRSIEDAQLRTAYLVDGPWCGSIPT